MKGSCPFRESMRFPRWTPSDDGFGGWAEKVRDSRRVIHEEFREGNVSPGTGHGPFLKDCLRRLPDGVRVTRFRADSASYQAEVFNLCFETGIRFVVGGDPDTAVRAAIGRIPPIAWRPCRDGHIAETVHTMNKTHNAFRLIVVRKRIQGSLPGLPTEPPSSEIRYKVLATNHKEIPEWVKDWDNQREDESQGSLFQNWRPGPPPLSSVSGTHPLRGV